MGWSDDLKNIAINNRNLTERQLRAGLFDAANAVIVGSPVGNKSLWKNPNSGPNPYVAGSYRSNHRISINRISSIENNVTSQGGVLMELNGEVARFKIGETLFMTNPLPYAVAIEYAHSSQAPDGVYRPTVKRLVKFLNKNMGVNK